MGQEKERKGFVVTQPLSVNWFMDVPTPRHTRKSLDTVRCPKNQFSISNFSAPNELQAHKRNGERDRKGEPSPIQTFSPPARSKSSILCYWDLIKKKKRKLSINSSVRRRRKEIQLRRIIVWHLFGIAASSCDCKTIAIEARGEWGLRQESLAQKRKLSW